MTDELDDMLRLTLEDYRLSRGERRALQATLKRWNANDQQLGLFRSRAFAIAREELSAGNADAILVWLEDVVKTLLPQADDDEEEATAYFTPGDDCWQAIVRHLRRARESVDICVFTITDDRISSVIVETAQRGVAVRIITDNDKAFDAGSDIDRLRRAGLNIVVDQTEYHMHHKFALFDRRLLLTGSYNWTRGAAEYNEENLLVTNLASLVKRYAGEFDKLWNRLT